MQPNKLFCNGLNIAPQDGWALSFTPFPKRNTSRTISTLQTQYTPLFSNCKQIYTYLLRANCLVLFATATTQIKLLQPIHVTFGGGCAKFL